MRLTAPSDRECLWTHHQQTAPRIVGVHVDLRPARVGASPGMTEWAILISVAIISKDTMGMAWYLGLEQRHSLLAAGLTKIIERQPAPLALLERRAALEIGQREGRLTVTAVVGAEKRKERGVLGNGQQLAVA